MEDRLEFIKNGMKSASEAGANKLRLVNSVINSAEMPEDVRNEFKEIMKDLGNGISNQSSVKIQAVKDRIKPLQKVWEKKAAEEKVKNSYKLG